jgi:hypothetical protein
MPLKLASLWQWKALAIGGSPIKRWWLGRPSPRLLVAIGTLTLALLAAYNWPAIRSSTYDTVVLVFVKESELKDAWARRRFKEEVGGIVERHRPLLSAASRKAAAEVSSYSSCTKLVFYLVSDDARDRSDAHGFLVRIAEPPLAAALSSLAKDVDLAYRHFEAELIQNTEHLSARIVSFDSRLSEHPEQETIPDVVKRLKQAAEQMRAAVATAAFSIATDLALYKKLSSRLSSGLATLARTAFKRQVKRVSISVAVATVDGPAVVGDLAAAAMLLYTMYDMHASAKEFQREAESVFSEGVFQATEELLKSSLRAADNAAQVHRALRRASIAS